METDQTEAGVDSALGYSPPAVAGCICRAEARRNIGAAELTAHAQRLVEQCRPGGAPVTAK
jgi:hypothetical protein